jgi:hypothetical protein
MEHQLRTSLLLHPSGGGSPDAGDGGAGAGSSDAAAAAAAVDEFRCYSCAEGFQSLEQLLEHTRWDGLFLFRTPADL